jgi:hypothetical protein
MGSLLCHLFYPENNAVSLKDARSRVAKGSPVVYYGFALGRLFVPLVFSGRPFALKAFAAMG